MSSISNKDVTEARKEYDNALSELCELEESKKKIIVNYVDELEQQKIQKIRSSM